MKRRIRGGFSTTVLVTAALSSGCGIVLGLDKYEDGAGTGGSGAGLQELCTPGKEIDCEYHGPTGTKDIGLCHAGTQKCKADGSGYGDCTGEVLPAEGGEICGNGVDDDCNDAKDDGCICTAGAKEDCPYSGLPATKDVGPCHAGQHTCNDDGKGYGACAGEVVPAPGGENCGNGVDDDCNGTKDDGCPCTPGDMTTCYDGAPNTENVGICHGGMKTCNADGMTYGPCMNQQLPQTENYPVKGDENCDGSPTSDTSWAVNFGDTNAQVAYAVAADASGNVLVTGGFSGSMQIGNTTLISNGSNNIFVAKLDPTGVPLWAKQFGDANGQTGFGIAADSMGNVVITGQSYAAINFGAGSVPAGLFVTKFDPNGATLWTKGCGGTNGSGIAIAIDKNNDVLVTGTFQTSANCGGVALSGPGSLINIVVAKFSSAGAHLWSKPFSDSTGVQSQSVTAIATDANNNVWLTGKVAGTVSFGGSNQNGGASGNVFLVKLSSGGAHVFSSSFGDALSSDAGVALALDPLGGPLLAIENGGTLNLGNGNITSPLVVAKFDSTGAPVWSKGFLANSQQVGIAVDSQGEGSLVGRFGSTVDFGGGPMTPTSGADGFLWHFDSQGNHIYAKQYASSMASDVNAPRAAAVDAARNILITGQFHGAYDFGTGVLSSPSGNFDAFVMKVAH